MMNERSAGQWKTDPESESTGRRWTAAFWRVEYFPLEDQNGWKQQNPAERGNS